MKTVTHISGSPLIAHLIDRAGNMGKMLATFSLYTLVIGITVNVILRKLANFPVPHFDEVSTYITAGVVFLGMAHCVRMNGHVRVELVLDRLRGDLGRKVQVIGMAISLFWIIGLTCALWKLWLLDFSTKEVTYGTLHLQAWIPGIVYLAGMTLFCLQVMLEIVRVYRDRDKSGYAVEI